VQPSQFLSLAIRFVEPYNLRDCLTLCSWLPASSACKPPVPSGSSAHYDSVTTYVTTVSFIKACCNWRHRGGSSQQYSSCEHPENIQVRQPCVYSCYLDSSPSNWMELPATHAQCLKTLDGQPPRRRVYQPFGYIKDNSSLHPYCSTQ